MEFTVTVITESEYDENTSIMVNVGTSIADVISNYGGALGIRKSMVALLNNAQVHDHQVYPTEGQVLAFRESTKDRG